MNGRPSMEEYTAGGRDEYMTGGSIVTKGRVEAGGRGKPGQDMAKGR